ncbi:heme exporter protein CcmD [Neptunomonas marina]|uniref:Heme exporter protein D n=1 Tax=Neptunomonas marina TaxID=1815562 RepID=A0A437Q6Z1_9GAMM|nr:heme exporter protein CcmD [Neptunomonas marina]
MQFETLADFFNMGGHGIYVWLSYALGLLLFAGNLLLPAKARKDLLKTLARRIRRENDTK